MTITNPRDEHVTRQVLYMCKLLLASKHVMCILACIDVESRLTIVGREAKKKQPYVTNE